MVSTEVVVLGIALALILGTVAGFFIGRRQMQGKVIQAESFAASQEADAKARAQEVLDRAAKDAERIVKDAELQAKDDVYKRREQFNRETEQQRSDLRENERKLEKRESTLETRSKELQKKEKAAESNQKKLTDRLALSEKRQAELDQMIAEEMTRLHQISGINRETAEKMLLERIEQSLAEEFAKKLQRHEEEFKNSSELKAREVLATCIQRFASNHTSEATVSTVDIPSDDLKGRIIGREGRNIRTIEKVSGVDVIVDDTPGVIIVSTFDNVRRETARLALTKLIQDGRIHPTRIEEVFAETQKEMDKHIMETGRAAVNDADCGPVHEKLTQLLGRLRFRTSYSQNVLNHSLEVCHLAGMIASEIGYDGRLARRCALLHDIGKAADHEMEGGHPKIGAELAKRYGETNRDVLHAIAGHHDEIHIDHPYTVIVAAADAISASRPGARRESLERYVKRLEELEAVAMGFPGIEQAFAIQAGRELRVIANSQRTTDAEARKVCHDIARAIEQQLNYPGEIKVTVIRETRNIEFAR